ncbi:MAG TPA: hypothetical protein VKP30_27100 [Polyangiaceae bacterium]|nr:hypothetical protein [Polyangiaceae bacterium]
MQSKKVTRRCAPKDSNATHQRELICSLQPVIRARVRRQLVRLGANLDEINDLTQEVSVRLLANEARALSKWNRDGGLSLPNYVGLIAERQATRLIVRQRRAHLNLEGLRSHHVPDSSSSSTSGPERIVMWNEMLRRLNRSFSSQLSPLGIRCFERLLLEHGSVASLCAETGLSRAAVYAWSSRLRARARDFASEVQ